MPKFSLLVRIHAPAGNLLRARAGNLLRLIESLENQTLEDWELVAIVGLGQQADRVLLADLAVLHPRLRVVQRPADELPAWTCNSMLDTLGDWVGFIHQDDWLSSTTLETVWNASRDNLDAKVIYTDEESRTTFGHASLRFEKGAINAVRLQSQEYLRDLAVINKAWLQTLDGFDPLDSDRPNHGVFLRTLELLGPGAFYNIPQRLYYRNRNYLTPSHDPRRKPHMVDYDLHAVTTHFERAALPASVEQINGTLSINYSYPSVPSVHLVMVLCTTPLRVRQQIRSLVTMKPKYPSLTLQLLHAGPVSDEVLYLLKGTQMALRILDSLDELPAALNQEALASDAEMLAVVQGLPVNSGWLHSLVDHARLPGVAAAGGRLMTPTYLCQPGILGWKYEGWDWNSRGRFNILAVSHQMSLLSPAAVVYDRRIFRELGGYDSRFPTLYGQDMSLRLQQAGHGSVYVPDSQVIAYESRLPVPGEKVLLQASWEDWVDPFKLHLSL